MAETFTVQNLTVHPADVGFGCVSRARVYSVLVRRSCTMVARVQSVYDSVKETFASVGGKLCIDDCLVATEEEVLAEENEVRLKRSLPLVTVRSTSWDTLCPGSFFINCF